MDSKLKVLETNWLLLNKICLLKWVYHKQTEQALQNREYSMTALIDSVGCGCAALTLSSRFFHASSRWDISSMQCDNVARIPAVVALNVNDSPLKSMACAPCCCRILTAITNKLLFSDNQMDSAMRAAKNKYCGLRKRITRVLSCSRW